MPRGPASKMETVETAFGNARVHVVQDPIPGRCHAYVMDDWSSHQCHKNAKHSEGGRHWCGIHRPSKKAAKDRARRASLEVTMHTSKVRDAHRSVAEIAIAAYRQEASFDDLDRAVSEYEARVREMDELKAEAARAEEAKKGA